MLLTNNPFPFFVGVDSLHKLAHKHTRVCVMNILGNESSKVIPVSHAYSGGNVVAGVQYGREGGVLETPLGDVPVYGSVRSVLKAGHRFDTGVIYLPPAAVSHAISEMCSVNDEIQKIVILTEKISVKDARTIRFGCQNHKIDVFGANSLGIANPWDHVRVGGALGGDNPEESLKKGSVAIYSNSGNFSTTISEYIKTTGFGTSTILSSGKDLYIHFALAEFLFCAENDPRTKAIVAYIEPGGYYEKLALDWIEEGRIKLTKPIISIVTGRWKKNLTRACGHAGAMSESGDDAEAKEKWFDDFFGVPVFNPDQPTVSARGVRVKNIQHVAEALGVVMKELNEPTDFQPIGDLSLKPWFANTQSRALPPQLDLKVARAISPYDVEIELANRLVGSQIIRQNMHNKSGVTMMDREDQVTRLHGKSMLELVEVPFGASCIFAISHTMPDENQMRIVNPLLNWFVSRGTRMAATAVQGRESSCSPNAYIGAAVLLEGDNPFFRNLRLSTAGLIDLFYQEVPADLEYTEEPIQQKLDQWPVLLEERKDQEDVEYAFFFIDLIKQHNQATVFTRFTEALIERSPDIDSLSLVIAALLLGLVWKPMLERRITRRNVEDLSIYLALNGVIVGCAAIEQERNEFWKKLNSLEDPGILNTGFTSTCFQILFAREPLEHELFELNAVLNLTISNGAGTLSAKGAKESVSARNHLPTTYAGFLTNTGFAHGGNGYEAIEYLTERFGGFDPYKTDGEDLNNRLQELAKKSASDYAEYKKHEKDRGNLDYKRIPCTNHPVFKGKPINIDPRESFIRKLFAKDNIVNPFIEFYHHLVNELFNIGVTSNVFCVNIDAVIAAVCLELFWSDLRSGKINEKFMQDMVFTLFLVARMVGASAEISDHLNRGTDMDCRTPAAKVLFTT